MFKIRSEEMRAPTQEEAVRYNLNVFTYTYSEKLGSQSTMISPSWIGDGVIWATAHMGDDEPYYVFYYCGTNCTKIVENTNGVWKNIQSLSDLSPLTLHGIVHKMLLKIGHV